MLVEIRISKMPFVRSQKQMRNLLLETGGKSHSCCAEKNNLGKLCASVLWKGELVSDELEYLAKIPKYSVEAVACFSLVPYNKLREERDKMKLELLGKKGTNI